MSSRKAPPSDGNAKLNLNTKFINSQTEEEEEEGEVRKRFMWVQGISPWASIGGGRFCSCGNFITATLRSTSRRLGTWIVGAASLLLWRLWQFQRNQEKTEGDFLRMMRNNFSVEWYQFRVERYWRNIYYSYTFYFLLICLLVKREFYWWTFIPGESVSSIHSSVFPKRGKESLNELQTKEEQEEAVVNKFIEDRLGISLKLLFLGEWKGATKVSLDLLTFKETEKKKMSSNSSACCSSPQILGIRIWSETLI